MPQCRSNAKHSTELAMAARITTSSRLEQFLSSSNNLLLPTWTFDDLFLMFQNQKAFINRWTRSADIYASALAMYLLVMGFAKNVLREERHARSLAPAVGWLNFSNYVCVRRNAYIRSYSLKLYWPAYMPRPLSSFFCRRMTNIVCHQTGNLASSTIIFPAVEPKSV